MSDISIQSNSNKALQDIQTLLDRMEGAPEIEPTGGRPEPKKPLTLGGSAPTVPKAPVPAQPEIEPAGPNANPEGGLLNVPTAVDKFVKGGPKLLSGGRKPVLLGGQKPDPKKPDNQPATRMADTMFNLMDVILLIQKSAQERRKTSLEALRADRYNKMQNLIAEAGAIGKAGEISAKFAYVAAGLQTATTALSAGLTGVGVKAQAKAFSESGLSTARADKVAATNDQDLMTKSVSAQPDGQFELNDVNKGKVEIPAGMRGTQSLMDGGVPYKTAQGEYAAAKIQVAEAQQKVDGALKEVGAKTQELADAKASNKPEAEKATAIKAAEKNLTEAQKDLRLAKDNLAEMKSNCAEKAVAYTKECAKFKTTMDADIKAAEANLKAGRCGPSEVENMKTFRETECKNMLAEKDLQSAFDERIKFCQEQLDVASNRFVNGAAANDARKFESFAQLSKAAGDSLSGFFSATGGAKDAAEKQEAKTAAAKAEQNQQDGDDQAAKAKQALDQLNQANELIKFLAEASRATTNRILGA